MIKAIVFDFDGVLADSEPLHLRAYQEAVSSLGLTLTREAYYTHYLGYDDEGVFTALAASHGFALDAPRLDALVAEKGRVFDAIIESGNILYPRAVSCIERMAPVFPLGIASGALRPEIESILRGSRLDHHFRFIVASGDTPVSKPAPDPYRRAAELHGVRPSECLAIEDSHWGLQSARAAGMRTIAVTHTYPRDQLALADRIIESLDELTPTFVETLG